MRLHRFYVSQPLGEEVVIEDAPTIKQWTKVLRYTAGASVVLFNGDGNDYTYKIQRLLPTVCALIFEEKSSNFIPSRKSYLFLSVIKKDLFELVVEKAVELGITDVIPIITSRTEKKVLNYERLTSINKEASEQSGRGDLITIHETVPLKKALDFACVNIPKENIFIATLLGNPLNEYLDVQKTHPLKPIAFFIGPEGGWTDEEEFLLKDTELRYVSFGKTTLRAETAAIQAAVVIPLL